MLMLLRRIGEKIYIDDGKIKITVLFEKEGRIAIGVEAPKHITIDRKEIFIRKKSSFKKSDKEASCVNPS